MQKPNAMGYYTSMSRKTDNIYKALENLNQLKQRLTIYNESIQEREIDNIAFELGQQVNELKFWISSLYSYNGKSTSNAKKAASRENGKKGGRPPKQVTLMRRRRIEIENEILPELDRKMQFAETSAEEKEISAQIEAVKKELSEILASME